MQSPLRVYSEMPAIVPMRLCKHSTLVHRSISGNSVDRHVMPCLELPSHMLRKVPLGVLVKQVVTDVWSSLGVVQELTTWHHCTLPLKNIFVSYIDYILYQYMVLYLIQHSLSFCILVNLEML